MIIGSLFVLFTSQGCIGAYATTNANQTLPTTANSHCKCQLVKHRRAFVVKQTPENVIFFNAGRTERNRQKWIQKTTTWNQIMKANYWEKMSLKAYWYCMFVCTGMAALLADTAFLLFCSFWQSISSRNALSLPLQALFVQFLVFVYITTQEVLWLSNQPATTCNIISHMGKDHSMDKFFSVSREIQFLMCLNFAML